MVKRTEVSGRIDKVGDGGMVHKYALAVALAKPFFAATAVRTAGTR